MAAASAPRHRLTFPPFPVGSVVRRRRAGSLQLRLRPPRQAVLTACSSLALWHPRCSATVRGRSGSTLSSAATGGCWFGHTPSQGPSGHPTWPLPGRAPTHAPQVQGQAASLINNPRWLKFSETHKSEGQIMVIAMGQRDLLCVHLHTLRFSKVQWIILRTLSTDSWLSFPTRPLSALRNPMKSLPSSPSLSCSRPVVSQLI